MMQNINSSENCNFNCNYNRNMNSNSNHNRNYNNGCSCCAEQKKLKRYIDLVSFAALDCAMFLDTHPESKEALEYFEYYKNARKQAIKEYSSRFSPLNLDTVPKDTEFWAWANKPCHGKWRDRFMWNYEKRLEYPINIKRTDAAMAKAIISQFGGPDGETGAAMRYLSQRFAMPYRPVMGILTDIGTEASKYEFVDLV